MATGLSTGDMGGHESPYLVLDPQVGRVAKRLVLSLGTPFFLSLKDGRLKPRTFDDWRDAGAALDRISYQAGRWSVRLGRFASVVHGEGTLIGGYRNDLSVEHLRPGVQLSLLPVDWLGLELFSASMFDAQLFALSTALKPLAGSKTAASRLVVRTTAALAPNAPLELAMDGSGATLIDEQRDVFLVEHEKTLAFAGIGVSLPHRPLPGWELRWYADMNGISSKGGGLHLGLAQEVFFSGVYDHRLELRDELVVASDRYLPHYFDDLYDLQSFMLNGDRKDTKAQRLDNADQGLGYVLKGSYKIRSLLSFAAALEKVPGKSQYGGRAEAELALARAWLFEAQIRRPPWEAGWRKLLARIQARRTFGNNLSAIAGVDQSFQLGSEDSNDRRISSLFAAVCVRSGGGHQELQ